MKTLICQFDSTSRHYHYLYTGGKNVAIGDHAVVHSNGAFKVVQIKGVRRGVDKAITKTVLAVLTKAEFDAYLVHNEKIGEYRAAYDELDHMIAEDKRLDKYREFAARTTNPRAQELIRQINGFSGENLLAKPFSFDDVNKTTNNGDYAIKNSVVEEQVVEATEERLRRITREEIERARPYVFDRDSGSVERNI